MYILISKKIKDHTQHVEINIFIRQNIEITDSSVLPVWINEYDFFTTVKNNSWKIKTLAVIPRNRHYTICMSYLFIDMKYFLFQNHFRNKHFQKYLTKAHLYFYSKTNQNILLYFSTLTSLLRQYFWYGCHGYIF